ncbi:hypothetical protein [Pleurocapsa sp. CCALA 161]|nr:hypothetical protein [Pleurocapsa sp. CCALA 161]
MLTKILQQETSTAIALAIFVLRLDVPYFLNSTSEYLNCVDKFMEDK